MARNIRIAKLVSRSGHIAGELQGLHFQSFHPPAAAWQPAVNVYVREDRFEVCVDIAGVTKQEIEVQLVGDRLVVRGRRLSPEPDCDHPPCGRVWILEIPEGEFERVLDFPVALDSTGVIARQSNGLLWITLPMARDGT